MARPNWEYIRVDVLLPDNPKLDGLTASAKWTLIELWCYCGQHLTDGFVRDAKWPKFGTKRDRDALVRAGLIDRVPGGHLIHDYLEHQRSRAEVMDLKEKRRKAGEKGGHAKALAIADALASATASATPVEAVDPVDNSVNSVHGTHGAPLSQPKANQSRGTKSVRSSAPSPGKKRRSSSRRAKQVLQQVPKQNASKPLAEAEAEAEAEKSLADVVHQSNGSRPDLTDLIIEELLKATGKRVDDQWAAKTRDYILNGRRVTDPAAYIRQVIRTEPDPRTRFLPQY